MDDLTPSELQQLVLFYKQKAIELEFNLLQVQLKLNRALVNSQVTATKSTKSK